MGGASGFVDSASQSAVSKHIEDTTPNVAAAKSETSCLSVFPDGCSNEGDAAVAHGEKARIIGRCVPLLHASLRVNAVIILPARCLLTSEEQEGGTTLQASAALQLQIRLEVRPVCS